MFCLHSSTERIINGRVDMVIGSRVLNGTALQGGMPWWKFMSNRVLAIAGNLVHGTRLTDAHTGFRAFSYSPLTKVRFLLNSDDSVFDSQMIAQAVRFRFATAELPVQACYFPEACSVNFSASTIYCLKTLGVTFFLQKCGLHTSSIWKRISRKLSADTTTGEFSVHE